MRQTTICLVLVFALLTSPGFAEPMFTFADETGPNGERIATGIVNLPVIGMVFDVEFSPASLSFDEIFGTGDPPMIRVPFFFEKGSGANRAQTALRDLYNLLPVKPTLFGPIDDHTTFGIGTYPSSAFVAELIIFDDAILTKGLYLDAAGAAFPNGMTTGRLRDAVDPDASFAIFRKQQVVPEPTSVVLLASITSCCLCVRYRGRCPATARS